MSDVRPVFYILGVFLSALAVTMMIPALVDLAADNRDWQVFMAAAALTLFVGVALIVAFRGDLTEIDLRQGFLLTATTWLVLSAFGALPFMFSEQELSFTDAYFETVSGLTTTGATVIVGLDSLPPGILLWRALLQFVGGAGIIVMAIAVFPFLRIGGMQLFWTESSEKSDKVLPRLSSVAGATVVVYVAMTVACALLFLVVGLSPFDAITHAMTTTSTGGFANYDNSFGQLGNPEAEWIATIFMFLGGCPLVLLILLARGQVRPFLTSSQVQVFLGLIVVVSVGLGLWLFATQDIPLGRALRLTFFNVTSVVSTTGFASTDYNAWGGLAWVLLLMLMFVGGCTGSTSGSVKVFRLEILVRRVVSQLRAQVQPHGVFPIRYMNQLVQDDVPVGVMAFFAAYMLSFALLTVIIAACGYDFVTAITAVAAALGNVGPGLGDIVGPVGNYQPLSDLATWVLSFAMLLGRLEIFTLLMLFAPRLWRG
ncbi:MAG: TrkH family potassium uptake protein [Alphaproteobacteria bacterium]|nr:TrkH family potassium uptake protein [Alphaproteobacteria bacterium]